MKRHINRWLNTFDDDQLLMKLRLEIASGLRQHGHFVSSHELYALLKEELEEFWDGVKERDPDPKELLQICALAYQGVIDLCEAARQEVANPHSNSMQPTQEAGG